MSQLRTNSRRRPGVLTRALNSDASFWYQLLVAAAILALTLSTVALAIVSTPAQALDENGCTMCHASPDISKDGKSLTVTREDTEASAHRYLDCLDCHARTETESALAGTYLHAKEDSSGNQLSALEMNKLTAAQFCGKCHEYQYEVYENSVHGADILKGYEDDASQEERQAAADSASCLDCHSATSNAHDVVRVLNTESVAYHKNIPDTCGNCHDDDTMMGRYGLDSYVYDGYQRDFHGKAVMVDSYELEDRMPATCADCHGTHGVQATASIDMKYSCVQCHDVDDGDKARFLESWMGHTEPSADHFPVVYYIRWIYWILVPATLLFGTTHVLLAFLKWLRGRGA